MSPKIYNSIADIEFEREMNVSFQEPTIYSAVFLNPHSYLGLRRKKLTSTLINRRVKFFVDGVGLKLFLMLFAGRVTRITGYQFFSANFNKFKKNLFIGGDPEQDYFNKVKIGCDKLGLNSETVYLYAPPYLTEFNKSILYDIDQKIKEINPDAVWICVGAPKQEDLLLRITPSKETQLIACVGAVIDDLAYPYKHPPRLISSLGLEWLFRLLTGFRRTWKRVLISYPLFLLIAFTEFLKR